MGTCRLVQPSVVHHSTRLPAAQAPSRRTEGHDRFREGSAVATSGCATQPAELVAEVQVDHLGSCEQLGPAPPTAAQRKIRQRPFAVPIGDFDCRAWQPPPTRPGPTSSGWPVCQNVRSSAVKPGTANVLHNWTSRLLIRLAVDGRDCLRTGTENLYNTSSPEMFH